MKKFFGYLWVMFLTICAAHYIYAVFNFENIRIINIEHIFYLSLLGLAAISMSNLHKGKAFLYLICLLTLSHIYFLPEFEEIIALESCNEGKCEPALKMGIVKIENGRTAYIPEKER